MALRIMIDKEFKSLIQPLRVEEYKNLEESLINEGCRDPIILWNDVIVDGHNRYEICTRLNIPFNTIHKGFSSRAEAISWICLNQLSRRNITEEAFRYLIGKRYDAEHNIEMQLVKINIVHRAKGLLLLTLMIPQLHPMSVEPRHSLAGSIT